MQPAAESSPDRTSAPHAGQGERSLAGTMWPLLLIMALMLVASVVSVLLVSWTRAYAHGHAVWAIAEHQAVYELHAYAETGSEASYQRFRRELSVPLADRVARLQLLQPEPDLALVHRSFRAGRIPEQDIAGLVHMFRLFKYHPLMAHAVDTWAAADMLVLELDRTGELVRAEHLSGNPDPERLRRLAQRADGLHLRITPHLREFGTTVGDAAAQIVAILMVVLPLCALALVAVGVAIFRALDRRARRAADALRELSARLEYQATHDSLTGLANRRHFEALVAAAITRHHTHDCVASLLYFDLDQFKVVNDTCGHAAGDELIRQIARRVERLIPPESVLARVGGDEFGVLAQGQGVESALQLAEQIRQQIEELRFYWNDKAFAVSASIGVLALGDGVASTADALSAADQACYLAKDNGRNRIQHYRPDDQQMQMRRGEMHWVERLQNALDNDGFTLVAQEIRPVAFRAQIGGRQEPRRRFELLLRLPDADGQLLGPLAFMPAAERYGLMPRIDRWVIARACRELAALREGGQTLPTCMINLSGASASDPELADYIADCLRRSGLDGWHIGFELTETVAVSNLASCSLLMKRLRALGCPIALDDFGTGMSSFSYLRSLPIDLLKIDRAFIRNIVNDPIDHAMVETIQRIAGVMGIRTVAEGIETEEVLAALALIGVDFAQGFHVRRPVPLVQMHADTAGSGDTSVRLAVPRSAAS